MFSPDFFCPNHHLFAQQIAKKKLKPREGELQPLPLALIPMLNLNVFCAHGTKAFMWITIDGYLQSDGDFTI